MKRIFVLLIVLLSFFPIICFANEKVEVKFSSCVDGDTAKFVMDGEIIKVRSSLQAEQKNNQLPGVLITD